MAWNTFGPAMHRSKACTHKTRRAACPLFPNSGQNVAVPRMSAKCHKPTTARQVSAKRQQQTLPARSNGPRRKALVLISTAAIVASVATTTLHYLCS